ARLQARSASLEDAAHDAVRVREPRVGRDDRLDPALGERTVADLAPPGTADRSHLADAEGREVVVQHVRLPRLTFQLLDALFVALRAEGRHRQRLRLAAGEETRAVRAREQADFHRHLADLVRPPAVRSHPFGEHHLAQLVALEGVQDLADVPFLLPAPLVERRRRLRLDAVHLLLAGLLAGDADCLAQPRPAGVVERLLELRGVRRREERAFRLPGAGDEIALDPDDAPDVLGRE